MTPYNADWVSALISRIAFLWLRAVCLYTLHCIVWKQLLPFQTDSHLWFSCRATLEDRVSVQNTHSSRMSVSPYPGGHYISLRLTASQFSDINSGPMHLTSSCTCRSTCFTCSTRNSTTQFVKQLPLQNITFNSSILHLPTFLFLSASFYSAVSV
jgi:hypothetical protein